MAMKTPILVIHGIGHPKPDRLRDLLDEDLGPLLPHWELIPAFWGNLGAKSEHFGACLPGGEWSTERAWVTTILDAVRTDVRSDELDDEAIEVLVRSLVGREPEAPPTRDDGGDVELDERALKEIREALAEAWSETDWLRLTHDPEILSETGRLLAGARWNLEEADATRAISDQMIAASKRVIRAMDRACGAVLDVGVGSLYSSSRRLLGPHVAQFLGDITTYHYEEEAIQGQVLEALRGHHPDWGSEDRPATIIAHSLGGLIAFDLAVSSQTPIHIEALVTIGSQPAFFHTVRRRRDLPPYEGAPVVVPRISRWLNLCHPLDPLSFRVGEVFKLADGSRPVDQDLEVLGSDGLFAHSSYWSRPEAARAIKSFLRLAPAPSPQQ